SRCPVRTEPDAKHEAHDFGVTPRASFDAVDFEVLVVNPPACGRDSRVHLPLEPLSNRLQIRSRARTESFRQSGSILAPYGSGELVVEKQPAAVLFGNRPAETRQPSDEVRFRFVGKARQMAPFMGDNERTFERQKIALDERLEQVRISHPRYAGST